MLHTLTLIVCALTAGPSQQGWLVVSFASSHSTTLLSDYAALPEPEPETGEPWQILDGLTALLCIVLECTADSWRLEASSNISEKVARRIESQIEAFEARGIRPDLSQAECQQGIRDANAAGSFIYANPGVLDPRLESHYLVVLDEIIEELGQP